MLLNISNLKAQVGQQLILKGLNLQVNLGEVHAIMGPNGSGKSSLSKILGGHPEYQVTEGNIEFEINYELKNILNLSVHERAQAGLFIGFQYPVEIPGLNNFIFLFEAYNSILESQGVAKLNEDEFRTLLLSKMSFLGMNENFLERPVNVGFSGGEKKRNEILQLLILNPKLAILDEIDSGLDIDALKIVAQGINVFKKPHNSVILITHYQRLLNYIRPDYVHILIDGRIQQTGGWDLVTKLEQQGYDGILS